MKDKRRARAQIILAIRNYFASLDFIETDTPSLVKSPGMEPHIRPLRVRELGSFLPTSPEFAMKRLLAQGYEKIFQICKAYRNEPLSTTHNPEFAILEWYRGHSDYFAIMDDVEGLFDAISKSLYGHSRFERPWPRITVEQGFREFAGLELTELLRQPGFDDDAFFRIMLNSVEPGLARLESPSLL